MPTTKTKRRPKKRGPKGSWLQKRKRTMLCVATPWSGLSQERKSHCAKLGITETVWENNRKEKEERLGLYDWDWLFVSSDEIPWAKDTVQIAIGSAEQKARQIHTVYSRRRY